MKHVREPGHPELSRRRRLFGVVALFCFVTATLLPLLRAEPATAAGSTYNGGGGGTGGGLSGLPVLGVHSVGASAVTLVFNVPMATITVKVPANTFVAKSQVAILNAASLANSPDGWGNVSFAYVVVGKTPTGTFINTFKHAINISIASTIITGHQGVFRLSNNVWVPFAPATNSLGNLSYFEASGLIIEAVLPGTATTTTLHPTTTTTRPRATTTTRPRATTTTTRPRATTTTTRPRETTTTSKPKATTTTTKPKSTTTTKPKETTTTKPKSTTTTTKPKATTTTTKPKSTTTTKPKATTTTTKPKATTTTTKPKSTTTTKPKSTTTTKPKSTTTTRRPTH